VRRKGGVTLNGFLRAEGSGKTAVVFWDGRYGRFIKIELSYEVGLTPSLMRLTDFNGIRKH
jgi:hypothetical protein